MIDKLMTALNASGITFARDAWTNMPQTSYGVVDGITERYLWANNEPKQKTMECTVWIYSRGNGDEQLGKVKTALNSVGAVYRLAGRAFIDSAGLIQQRVSVTMRG